MTWTPYDVRLKSEGRPLTGSEVQDLLEMGSFVSKAMVRIYRKPSKKQEESR